MVIGAILCGGRSSRFGSDKALAEVDGGLLAARIIAAMRAGGLDPVVAVGGSAGDRLGIPTLPDRHPDQGPLAGLATALSWAGTGLVVVTSCDVPLLTAAHVTALVEAADADTAAVARVEGRSQPSLGCWPAEFGPAITAMINEGRRPWRSALDAGPWRPVDLPPEAVADADTPDELRALIEAHRGSTSPEDGRGPAS